MGVEGDYIITMLILGSLVYLVWYATACTTVSSLIYLVCCIGSGK